MSLTDGVRRVTTSDQMMPDMYLVEVFSEEEWQLLDATIRLYPVFLTGEDGEVDLFAEAQKGSDLYGSVIEVSWNSTEGIEALITAITAVFMQ